MRPFNMLTKPPYSERMKYRIGRGEEGVLTIQPYKGELLPHWRFATVPKARESSEILWTKFLEYHDDKNFPGMDMARKFIQMGMTRAKRYANYKGGRKYVHGKAAGVKNEKGLNHAGKQEKEMASGIFREVWERCKVHEGYLELKAEFKRDQQAWNKMTEEEKNDFEIREVQDAPMKEEAAAGGIQKGWKIEDEKPAIKKEVKIEDDEPAIKTEEE